MEADIQQQEYDDEPETETFENYSEQRLK